MTMTETTKKFPLHQFHVDLGAKFGRFGDWQVPLYYSSIVEEHKAVRERAGLFDISHMGEFFVSGPDAVNFLDAVLPRDISKLALGKAIYMPLLNEGGGIVDDIIVYRIAELEFLIIVNAGNIDKDFAWMKQYLAGDVTFQNKSDEYGLLALQGPLAFEIVKEAFGEFYTDIKRFGFKSFEGGIMARTGYTGEEGVEIMVPKNKLKGIWEVLLRVGQGKGLLPVGFGARDTLRFEAAMPLYGHELSDETTPIEAKIDWAVDFEKEKFVGRAPLLKQKEEGAKRLRVGIEMLDRGIARDGAEIQKNEKLLGVVTSGTFSPTFKKNLVMGYVPREEAEVGNEVGLVVRGRTLKAKIVPLPFYKRQRSDG